MVNQDELLRLHHEAIIIDSTSPIVGVPNLGKNLDLWVRGGATCFGAEVAGNNSAREAIASLSAWHRELRQRRDEVIHATTVEDIRRAKREEKIAAVFHFQNTRPIEHDVGLLEIYHRLGVRVIQLAYNRRNLVGDGCEEPSDAGLSEYGKAVIAEMNRLGILVDLSHTGRRTTLEAIELSIVPCVFSHSNADAVCRNARNITDDQIRAVAAKGGVIGVAGFPAFVSTDERPTMDQYIDHIEYIVNLVGPDHVGLGLDYARDPSPDEFEEHVRTGKWTRANYPPPPWRYPAGLENASLFPNLTVRLAERGFGHDAIRKILGENFLTVFGAVWQS